MQRQIHEFDNGVKVFDDQLTQIQRDRYKQWNVHEAEEEDIFLEIIRAISANGCFVNIGAAIGYYPLLAKSLAPNLIIHAVEPLKRHRNFFVENINLNRLSSKDFVIHKEAISSMEGKARFVDKDYGSSLEQYSQERKPLKSSLKTFLKTLFAQTEFKNSKNITHKTIKVHTITLDRLMTIIGRPVDLLLMDIQGSEVDVLKSGSHSLPTGKVKTVVIGTHGREIHQECLTILREYGLVIEYNNPEPKDQPDGIIVARSEF